MPPVPTTPPIPPPWSSGPRGRQGHRRSWWTAAAVALSMVAVCLAIAAWFRPYPEIAQYPPTAHAPSFTDEQINTAKATVCKAYRKVRQALDVAGARNGGSDPIASLAVATSSRQALDVGSRYLLTSLNEQPATGPDLTAAVRKLASIYQELTIGYLADADDSEIDQLRRAAEQPTSVIDGLCK